jgi:hypothetical protein
VPLLSSIVLKPRKREENLTQESKKVQDGYQRKMKEIFIVREASRHYSNGRRFNSHAPTQVRLFKNCTSCVSYPHGQATASFSKNKVIET